VINSLKCILYLYFADTLIHKHIGLGIEYWPILVTKYRLSEYR